MKNIAVIYKSNYGATRQYAYWIAEELDAELLERKLVSPDQLDKYDYIVYGGGLYASGINGVDLVTKNNINNLVIFTVGLANPETTDYTDIINSNISKELQNNIKIFHLRGGMDYNELGLVHRGMMAMMKKMTIDKKSEDQLTDEDKVFLQSYGNKVDFSDKSTILPLIDYVKKQMTL